MAEYIDREKFLKRLGEEYPGIPPHGAIVVGMLCDEEPADVRPVVRGEWKPMDLTFGRRYCFCSACEMTVNMPTVMGVPVFRYCPYCGAETRE